MEMNTSVARANGQLGEGEKRVVRCPGVRCPGLWLDDC